VASALAAGGDVAATFDALRRSCPERREFEHFRVVGPCGPELARDLRRLGFAVADR